MKNKKKIKLLEERIKVLESIVTKSSLVLKNPDDENSFVRLTIKDNDFIVEGILISESVTILPITNQKIK